LWGNHFGLGLAILLINNPRATPTAAPTLTHWPMCPVDAPTPAPIPMPIATPTPINLPAIDSLPEGIEAPVLVSVIEKKFWNGSGAAHARKVYIARIEGFEARWEV
jgi:hypothetical protein